MMLYSGMILKVESRCRAGSHEPADVHRLLVSFTDSLKSEHGSCYPGSGKALVIVLTVVSALASVPAPVSVETA